MHRALIAAATLLLGVTPFAPNVALPKGRRRSVAPRPQAPRPQPQLRQRRETLLYVAIDDGSSINNGSVTPMIHACLSRQPNGTRPSSRSQGRPSSARYWIRSRGNRTRRASNRSCSKCAKKPNFGTRTHNATSPASAFSWPPKIGVTWTDDGKADLEVMGSQTRVPGEDG